MVDAKSVEEPTLPKTVRVGHPHIRPFQKQSGWGTRTSDPSKNSQSGAPGFIEREWGLSLRGVTGDNSRRVARAYNDPMQKETLKVESRAGSEPQTRVLRLSGSLTLDSCFDVQDLLRADTSALLIVDMSEVRYVDSSGIGCLVNGYMSHHMAGGRMVLAGVNPRIQGTLEETRVMRDLTVYENVEQAERECSVVSNP